MRRAVAITKPLIDKNDQDWGCKPKSTHHLEVAYVVFPSLPVKYLLRSGVLALFSGSKYLLTRCLEPWVVEVKKNAPKVTSKICGLCWSIAESTLKLPHQPWNWKWRNYWHHERGGYPNIHQTKYANMTQDWKSLQQLQAIMAGPRFHPRLTYK